MHRKEILELQHALLNLLSLMEKDEDNEAEVVAAYYEFLDLVDPKNFMMMQLLGKIHDEFVAAGLHLIEPEKKKFI